ncbi:MAG: hypothetical protein AAF420_02375 [Pseudomonadota bacterium]
MARERAYSDVPGVLRALVLLALALQVGFANESQLNPETRRAYLPSAPPQDLARVVALGEPVFSSRLMSAWLQTFDFQSGLSIPWRELDYPTLVDWLQLQLDLDPQNPFPMLAAAHLYGGITDRDRVRLMVDFIVETFRDDPAHHWRWMAAAVMISQHRLDDIALAENLATELDLSTRGVPIPGWARQMILFIRMQMGEVESAHALLFALIEGGEINDPEEIAFLLRRLENMAKNVEKSSLK